MRVIKHKHIKFNYRNIAIRIGIASLLVLVGFAVLNYSYFSKQLRFSFSRYHAPVPTPSSNTSQPEKMEPNLLKIPSLNISAPVQYIDKADEPTFQAALVNGVVHYPGTAEIGQPGNPYIFGHSSDFITSPGHYKTVFALLPRIQNGAEIIVSGKDGTKYTYLVTKQFVAEKTDVHLLDQGDYKEKLITLQTSYPLGTALKRYIVIGQLKE